MALNLATALFHLSLDTFEISCPNTHGLAHRVLQMNTEEDYSRYRTLLSYMVPHYHLLFSSQTHVSFERLGLDIISGKENSSHLTPLVIERDNYIRYLDDKIDRNIDASIALAHREDWHNERDLGSGKSLYMSTHLYLQEQNAAQKLFTEAAANLTGPELDFLLERTRKMDDTIGNYNRKLLGP